MIGGYAVAAYGPPRYSEDLDFVVPDAALPSIHDWLEAEKFASTAIPKEFQQNYGGRTERWIKADVTIDLLPGHVRDREAQVDLPEPWISVNPKIGRLVLLEGRTQKDVPVVRTEALWALKLQAGRLQDIADLFAIYDAPVDLEETRRAFEGVWCENLKTKLESVRVSVGTDKTYWDVLSQRRLGSPTLAKNRKAWERFVRRVGAAIPRP